MKSRSDPEGEAPEVEIEAGLAPGVQAAEAQRKPCLGSPNLQPLGFGHGGSRPKKGCQNQNPQYLPENAQKSKIEPQI